ncbi:MAG: hypothetical protein ABIH23_02990 [bacterium]
MKLRFPAFLISAAFIIVFLGTANVKAQDSVIPREFIVEPPTLICAGFEWTIQGDDNHNAAVTVDYRRKGEDTWRDALPLLRIHNEKTVYPNLGLDYTAPNMFAGSIFDLEPGTVYECKFEMSDPDGAQGQTSHSVSVTTRNEPRPFDSGRTLHVYPSGYKGPKEEPHYPDLLAAYYGKGQGYWGPAQVEPGDIILIHAGMYRADYKGYSSNLNLDFYGVYVLSKNGTPEKPITIRAAGDGEVVFDGDGCSRLFDVTAADYTYFDGLTICNADVAIYAGLRHVAGCDGLVVRNCIMENVGVGIQAQYVGSKNFHIADNVILGRDNRRRLHGWCGSWEEYGIPTRLNSFIGIDVNGQGHAVCHNYVAYFHDGIDVTQQGPPESHDPDKKAVSIDFYNNDIFLMADDFFEADCGVHNIRVFRNRCVNSAHHGLSAQPIYGGPAYFIRNLIYHVPPGGALKFNINPSGVLLYHNTFCAEWSTSPAYSNVHLRNNLFLGIDFPGRPILSAATYTSYTSFDYNGYRPNKNSDTQFVWRSPSHEILQDYALKGVSSRSFNTFEEFSRETGQEQHGIYVDYDIFQSVEKPDPNRPGDIYSAENLDFSLKPGSVAVDAACVLPNVNDTFTGKAPDLGALEVGSAVPVYGPRVKHHE